MSLQHFYRPKSFKTFVGNEDSIASLKQVLQRKNPPQSFMFTGNSGTGKCIVGDSTLLTTDGQCDIIEYSNNKSGFHELQLQLMSDQTLQTTSHFFEEDATDTIGIINSLGMSLEGTYEHPILCLDTETCEFVPKRLDELSTSDYSCVPRHLRVFNKQAVINKFVCSNPSSNFPGYINTDIAVLLGYIIAKGSITKKTKPTAIKIGIKTRKQQDEITKIITRWGQQVSGSYTTNDFHIVGLDLCALILSLLNTHSFPTATTKQIPTAILTGSINIQRIFLRTLLDCSMWHNKYKIEYCTSSALLAKQLQLMLLNFGIVSSKATTETRPTIWKVIIRGEYQDLYINTIGSVACPQQHEIDRLINHDIIPSLAPILHKKLNKIRQVLNVQRNGGFHFNGSFQRFSVCKINVLSLCTYYRLRLLMDSLNNLPQIQEVQELWDFCNLFITTNYYFSRIVSIKHNNKKVKVYDFTIPKTHLFFSNGFISHNTTLSRLVAKQLKCHPSEYVEKDTSHDRTMEGMKQLKNSLQYAPLQGSKKVILLDEFNNVPKASQQALLKLLEEPPSYVHFILCTTNPENALDTIKRRCHLYKLNTLRSVELLKLCKYILKKEKVNKFSSKVLNKIVEISDGSAGVALRYLDMVIDMTNSKQALQTLTAAGTSESEIIDICRTLLQYNSSTKNKWYKLKSILNNFSGDSESARRAILGYLTKVLLSNDSLELSLMITHFERNFYDSGKAGLINACYKAILEME